MNSNSNNSPDWDGSADAIERNEERNENKQSSERAHSGDELGPSSQEAGKTVAPQKGNPRVDDRARS